MVSADVIGESTNIALAIVIEHDFDTINNHVVVATNGCLSVDTVA